MTEYLIGTAIGDGIAVVILLIFGPKILRHLYKKRR